MFPAILTATNQGTADDKAIFIFNGTMLNEVVREGQAARDGNGIFGDSTFGFFDPPFSPVVSLNNAGQVLVGASFTNTSSGLFESALVRFEEGAVYGESSRTPRSAPAQRRTSTSSRQRGWSSMATCDTARSCDSGNFSL